MDKPIVKKLMILSAIIVFVLACEVPGLATPASQSSEPVSLETIVAGTAGAAQTQTAAVAPSATQTATLPPLPTATVTETPTATPTVIFIIPTSTEPFSPSDAGSQCRLTALVPFNPHVAPGTGVDISWTLNNTGDELWNELNMDFKYSSGTDMHKKDAYDLPSSVPPGGNVTITVPMVAPNKSGSYTTTWVLVLKKNTICKVSATIIVK